MDESKKQLKVNYEKSPNYVESHVNGIWGGINPDRKIQMYLYEDLIGMPEFNQMTVVQDNMNLSILEEKTYPEEPNRTRSIKCSNTFDPHKLDVFIKWLSDMKKTWEEKYEK